MLYLRQSADSESEAPPLHVLVAEPTAIGLERALLAPDLESRRRELIATLLRDPSVADWALKAAEHRFHCDRLGLEEAAAWLAGRLATELAAALVGPQEAATEPTCQSVAVDIRLPALAQRLAEYARKVEAFEARLEHEKLEALKELAYGASHEINNPLANIAARAQTLLQEEADPERRRKLSAIHRQAMRAHEMIADLMLFARPPKLKPVACDLRHLLREVVEELRRVAGEQDAELHCEPGDDAVTAMVDPTQIAVAVRAVVTNALEAIGEGGHVHLALRQSEFGGRSCAEITVRDDGPGISHEVRRHMFDPFFSGREAGRGLGFGLSKCWRIVTDHGGDVMVHQPAEGTELVIRLPMVSSDIRAD